MMLQRPIHTCGATFKRTFKPPAHGRSAYALIFVAWFVKRFGFTSACANYKSLNPRNGKRRDLSLQSGTPQSYCPLSSCPDPPPCEPPACVLEGLCGIVMRGGAWQSTRAPLRSARPPRHVRITALCSAKQHRSTRRFRICCCAILRHRGESKRPSGPRRQVSPR